MTGSSRLPARSVLIVEDEWVAATLIASSVRKLGCRVVGPAASVVHAIALLYGDAPDAALLDVTLGMETSYLIADALSECGIPFAFVTATPRDELPARFAGREVLPKPASPWALDQLVGDLVGLRPRDGSNGGSPGATPSAMAAAAIKASDRTGTIAAAA